MKINAKLENDFSTNVFLIALSQQWANRAGPPDQIENTYDHREHRQRDGKSRKG
jgi:hypothetical protein